jgi:hypothetical protein
MQKLFENWRKFISEEKTIDEDAIGMAQDLAASGKLGYDDVSQTNIPKASGRAIKDAFRKTADHQWLATLNTVHWGYDTHALADVIDKSKDELSATMSLPGAPFVQARPHPMGILIKGRITLAANDQDKLYSGGYFDYMGSDDEKEAAKQQHRAKSSGVNKLPQISKDFSRYGMLKRGNPYMEQMAIDAIPYVLDQQTWDWDPNDPDSSGVNEALVDNWRPLGLVIGQSDIIRSVKSVSQDPSGAIGKTKNLFALAEKHGIPLLDLNQNVLWAPVSTTTIEDPDTNKDDAEELKDMKNDF